MSLFLFLEIEKEETSGIKVYRRNLLGNAFMRAGIPSSGNAASPGIFLQHEPSLGLQLLLPTAERCEDQHNVHSRQ